MSILVDTVISRAVGTLNDLGFEHWTKEELVDALNEGQLEVIKLHPDAKTETRDMQLIAGSRQNLPSDCISLTDVACNKDGNVVTPCDRGALDSFVPGWVQKPTAATVKHWMTTEDPKVFYVYPAQNATPGIVVIVAAVLPNQVAPGGNIDVREVYAENLINFILFRALSKDAEFAGAAERAVAYYQAFSA